LYLKTDKKSCHKVKGKANGSMITSALGRDIF